MREWDAWAGTGGHAVRRRARHAACSTPLANMRAGQQCGTPLRQRGRVGEAGGRQRKRMGGSCAARRRDGDGDGTRTPQPRFRGAGARLLRRQGVSLGVGGIRCSGGGRWRPAMDPGSRMQRARECRCCKGGVSCSGAVAPQPAAATGWASASPAGAAPRRLPHATSPAPSSACGGTQAGAQSQSPSAPRPPPACTTRFAPWPVACPGPSCSSPPGAATPRQTRRRARRRAPPRHTPSLGQDDSTAFPKAHPNSPRAHAARCSM